MKQKISIPGGNRSPKDMSRNHYTTLGFGSIYPIYCEETVPKDKIRAKVSNFSRLAPMILPNLSNLTMKLHAFYVPFRLVWNHFDNFKEGLPSWNSQGAQVYKTVPHVDDVFLTRIFYDHRKIRVGDQEELANYLCEKVPNSTEEPLTTTGFDFRLVVNSTVEYYILSPLGKQVLHVLYALGYNFNWTLDRYISQVNVVEPVSLLPLLCWLKVYNDYFIPSQLQPSSYLNELLANLHDQTATQIDAVLPEGFIETIYQALVQSQYFYQNNYFTSAWQSPNAPLEGLNNIGLSSGSAPINNNFPVINGIHAQEPPSSALANAQVVRQPIGHNRSYTGKITPASGTMPYDSPMTSDGLTFLQKFARFIKRSNFAGSRAIERILARYGVRVDDFQIGMCKYLGNEDIFLQKADVTVTGNTEEAGEYTGKGWFVTEGKPRQFKCDCDYFGMFIITASIETPSMFVTGVRRRNMRIFPLDYWTPELDGGTMEAISGSELYGRDFAMDVSAHSLNKLGLVPNNVFGFTPKYSSYKTSIDDISGDFAVNRFGGNIQNFILPRLLFNGWQRYIDLVNAPNNSKELTEYLYDKSYVNSVGEVSEVSPVKTLFGNDMYQFNRIFKLSDGLADPIFSVFKVDCVFESPTLPLNESAELIGRGKVHEFETNGVHL